MLHKLLKVDGTTSMNITFSRI